MGERNIQSILKYYLEYEIYNILNSNQINIDDKTSFITYDIENYENICKILLELKQAKINQELEDFIGKKAENKQELIKQINNELIELNGEDSNKIQISFRLTSLLGENLKAKLKRKTVENFVSKLCDIKKSREFWLYAHYIIDGAKKLPLFILKCEIINEEVNVLEVNINKATLNYILSATLEKEISEVVLEYEEDISNYAKEISNTIDGGNIVHLLNLYYSKMEEALGITKEKIRNMRNEYIIALDELAEDSIKNIKEDIELLNKLIDDDGYVPNILNKYLNGSDKEKNDINDSKYEEIYRGNYKSKYGIGENQYKIVNAIRDNDFMAIEGPPGTGKTSLLKEIIAHNVVERANLILKNWDNKLKQKKYYGNKYYDIGWFHSNKNVIKSIVVSSKNGEAIENVGKEINKEIEYINQIAGQYIRTVVKDGKKQKIMPEYKGLVCLPLGKQDNIQDFKDFLYQKYIPMLENFDDEKSERLEIIKENYEKKCSELEKLENIVTLLNDIKNSKKYFYGIEIMEEDKDEEKNNKLEQIESIFKSEKDKVQEELNNLQFKNSKLLKKIKEQEEKIRLVINTIENIGRDINNSQSKILEGQNEIKKLQEEKVHFQKVNKNIITRIKNFKYYKENKNVNFDSKINEINIKNETERSRITEYIKEENNVKSEKIELESENEQLKENNKTIERKIKEIHKQIDEMKIISIFNGIDSKKYWSYKSIIDICGHGYLNTLNQQLFELALNLNEAYIAKNRKEIVENLKLFLPNGENSYICQKFYDSSDIYNTEKQEAIRRLWNTLFLCFPVVTTTLDSFSKRCFHLIPEYIDLELIDEAGQILPHNLVSALYRGKKAVIVGDINQIEPIYNSIKRNFYQSQKMIGNNFEDVKIEENSVQALANKHTDILNNGDVLILNDHYRCEENIVNFSNKNVYSNKLNMHIGNIMNKPFLNNMVLLDVRGKKEEKEHVNKVEIESCIETIKYILEKNENDTPTIAIITPFKRQKENIEKRLEKEGIEGVKVGTVHAFQGQERDYIIFSQVIDSLEKRSLVNFIGKKCNMLNVAVTRAKKQFIFIGNLDVALRAENYITKLAKYIGKSGRIYSLYDIDDQEKDKTWDERILKILQPELNISNDYIGLYIQKNIKNGVIMDAKQHYEFLKYAIENAKKEIYIMSPWYRDNVINDGFINSIQKLKQNNCRIKICFGYKKRK